MDSKLILGVIAIAVIAALAGAWAAGFFSPRPEPITIEDTFYTQAPSLDGMTWVNGHGTASGDNASIVAFYSTSCSPCSRTVEALANLSSYYGIPFSAVHSASYGFEGGMIAPTVARFGWAFPIGVDNGSVAALWRNQFVPQFFVVDYKNRIRYSHVGESKLDAAEESVRIILNETGKLPPDKVTIYQNYTKPVYSDAFPLGAAFADKPLGNDDYILANGSFRNYSIPFQIKPALVYAEGSWRVASNYTESSGKDYSTLAAGFVGASVYVTAAGNASLLVQLDGKALNATTTGRHAATANNATTASIDAPGLYELAVNLPRGPHIVTLSTNDSIKIYEISFG